MAIGLRTMNIFSIIMMVSATSVVSILLHFPIFWTVSHIFAEGFKGYFLQRMASSIISSSQWNIPFFWHEFIKYSPMTRVIAVSEKTHEIRNGKIMPVFDSLDSSEKNFFFHILLDGKKLK